MMYHLLVHDVHLYHGLLVLATITRYTHTHTHTHTQMPIIRSDGK